MRIHHSKTAIPLLLIALETAILVASPGYLFARGPSVGVMDPLDYTVGGEPGEDPHLRHDPIIRYDDEIRLGGSASGTTAACEIDRVRLMGGETAYGGSQVKLVWRAFLQHLVWMLHR